MSTQKKYDIVFSSIVADIADGRLRAAERLPSQLELAEKFSVSIGTVQKALNQLEHQGVVVTRHGSGTYVTTDSPSREEIVNFRFLDPTGRVLPLYTKVESVTEETSEGPWREHLGDKALIAVRRIVNVDLQFATLSTVYLRRREFGFLLDQPLHTLDGHELTRIIERNRLPSFAFRYHIAAAELSEYCVKLNHLEPGVLGLTWNIFGFTARDVPNWYQVIELPLTHNRLEISGVVGAHKISGEDASE